MSLIIGVSYRDQFVIASNDSMVTREHFHSETLEPSGKPEPTDIKKEKVFKLTDKVLLCVSGAEDPCDLIRTEMFKRVDASTPLGECANALESTIADLKAKTDLNDYDKLTVRFIDSTSFTCYMVGFLENGLTGVVTYSPYSLSVETMECPPSGPYPVFISSPEESDLQYQQYLNLPEEERNIESFLSNMMWIHSELAKKHSNMISTDCNIHALVKTDGAQTQYFKTKVETKGFREDQ